MQTARELMDRARARISEHGDAAGTLGAVYRFVLEGEGGGTWTLNLGDAPGVTEGAGDADCVLRLSADDYVALVEGRTDGQQLYFSGKLHVDGDMSLAVKLEKLTAFIR